MTSWLLPTLAYVGFLGLLGILTKFALRGMTWQEMILWTAVAYAVVAVCLVVFGGTSFVVAGASVSAFATGLCAALGLVCFFVALNAGDVKTVVPITSAYPVVAMFLAALLLAEKLSLAGVAGAFLVVVGVVILSLA